MDNKICTKCKIEKPATSEYFNKGKGGKFGLRSMCIDCRKECAKENRNHIRQYNKLWREKEEDHIKQYEQERYKKEREARLTYARKHYQDSAESIKDYQKQYYLENTEYILLRNKEYRNKNREKLNAQERERNKDKANKLIKVVRTQVWRVLKHNNGSKINSNKVKVRTWDALPYTPKELIKHLESLFEPWMNWENYGKSKNGERVWNVDHIIPQAKLALNSLDHPNFIKCWSLSNLRPLCSKENLRKNSLFEGVRYTYER